MYLDFPEINHINDVLPHVLGREDFYVKDKGEYTVINYMMLTSDTFRSPYEVGITEEEQFTRMMRRECRGLIFDNHTGLLISRPYHKFFNIGENEESLPANINLAITHNIFEKLDGSMIRFFRTSDGILRVGTKAGETDVSAQVWDYIDERLELEAWIVKMIQLGRTPIFEWCSFRNRVVIGHPVDRLVLTAIRHNATGFYYDLDYVVGHDRPAGLEIVKTINIGYRDATSITNVASGLVGEEGFVVRFIGGQMYKAKSDWYLAIHKAKDDILYERNVVKLIIEEKIDDVLPHLLDADKANLERYRDEFYTVTNSLFNTLCKLSYNMVARDRMTRKEFALNPSKSVFGPFAHVIFANFDLLTNSGSIDGWHAWVETFHAEFYQLMIKKTNSNSDWAQFKLDADFSIDYYISNKED